MTFSRPIDDCVDLTLEHEDADLQSTLSVLLWGGVHHRNVVVRCVQFQRQHNLRHYEALVKKGTWSEDAIILKVRKTEHSLTDAARRHSQTFSKFLSYFTVPV